ncbi:MAG: hypothetical protein IT204_25605 [Fimbriimonadaceae bacterium]|nr:hypothetical protein [Fimbriimonadaceae bacterium]
MPETVLVSAQEYVKGEAVFEAATDCQVRPAPGSEADLAAIVRETGARAVIVGVTRYEGPLYHALATNAAGRGGLIARFGVGHESVDKALAAEHGLLVTNTPGVLDQSVAELTIGLLIALARHVGRGHHGLVGGRWDPVTGIELAGCTLGLVGCGPIARRVAGIASRGLGMRVLASGRSCGEELAAAAGQPLDELLAGWGVDRYTTDVDELLAASDAVSLHLPGSAVGFLDASRLARLQPTALLINTARGSVVDELALYRALVAERLAGAAIDVYGVEPYRPADPRHDLRTLSNVLLTPHIGSNTAACNARMAAAALRNVRFFLAGRLADLNRVEA